MGVTYWKVGVSLLDHMMYRHYHFRLTRNQLILWPEYVMSLPSIRDSPLLQGLLISSHTHHVYTHCTHRLYPVNSTPTGSSHDLLEEEPQQGDSLVYNGLDYCHSSSDVNSNCFTERYFVPTELPSCLFTVIPRARALPSYYYCSDSGAMRLHGELVKGGPPSFIDVITRGCDKRVEHDLFPCQPGGLYAIYPYHGWSNLRIPGKYIVIGIEII